MNDIKIILGAEYLEGSCMEVTVTPQLSHKAT